MKSLMRPGGTLLSGRSRFTFERKKLQQQSSLCHIKNKVLCVFLVIFLAIVVILCTIYFDVATHSDDISHESQSQHAGDIIIESEVISASHEETAPNRTQTLSNTHDIYITSRTAYISTLDIHHDNFLNLLHRRSLGFELTEYQMMKSILTEYGQFAQQTIENDIANNRLDGEYIIITPAAQMCNRMRALMGSVLLGLLTQRVVFIDIGAEGYAARLNNIFISPGYQWEYSSIPQQLKSLIGGASHARWTFPYEWLHKHRAVTGVIANQVCDRYCSGAPCKPGKNGKRVWKIDSHAGYLPVMARNEHLYNAVINYHKDMKYREQDVKYSFDYKLATHFIRKISENGQEYIESLEVLLGRMLFELEDNIQKEVDRLIRETYDKAMAYYTDKGVDVSVYNMVNNPPPVIGIHIRSEYVLLMNPNECPGKKISNCNKPYHWFEDCGIEALDQSASKHLNGVQPYLFIAADTKEAQHAAQQIFGAERVAFRPFENTGSVFIGIQEAIIDLVSVSSFDIFVGTPHSSYSEMSSILSQPRRIFNENKNGFEFEWDMISMATQKKHLVPVNRMIIPIMTNVGWEIDKLNLYTMGRAVDVNIDTHQLLIPQTDEKTDKYKQNRVCKQTVTAGMGWMGLFDMFKNVKCYNPNWHHPSPKCLLVVNGQSTNITMSPCGICAISLTILLTPLHCTTIIASGTVYRHQNITCDQWDPCVITCASDQVCLGTNIMCPSNNICTISCTSSYSCDGFTVHCPLDNTCSISCTGERSCRNMVLYPPTNALHLQLSHPGTAALSGVNYPIYPVDDSTDYSLLCDTKGLCQGMNIICPQYARCNITCSAQSSCMDAVITWPITAGYGTIICVPSHNYACRNVIFPAPDPYILHSVLCDGLQSCYESTIVCPTSTSCDISCSAPYACAYATIECPLSGNCTVLCTAGNACENVDILWSSLPTSKGFLICDESDGVCLNANVPPTLHPTTNPTVYISTTPVEIISNVTINNANQVKGWEAFMDALCSKAWVLGALIAIIIVLSFGFCACVFLYFLPQKREKKATMGSMEVVEIEHDTDAMHTDMKVMQHNMNMVMAQHNMNMQRYGPIVPIYANPQDINNEHIRRQLPETMTPEKPGALQPQLTFTSTTCGGDSMYATPRGEEADDGADAIWARLRKSTSVYFSDKKKPKRSQYRLEGIMQDRIRSSEFETVGGNIVAMDSLDEINDKNMEYEGTPPPRDKHNNAYGKKEAFGFRAAKKANIVKAKKKKVEVMQYDEGKYGKCTQMGCSCRKYVASTSKWSKNKCKKCNHKVQQHELI